MMMLFRKPAVLAIGLLCALTACGTPATPAPTLPPTLGYPTRVAIAVETSAGATVAPTTVPTTAPTSAPATTIAPTAAPTKRSFATATSANAGDPANGAVLFAKGNGGAAPACSTCHNIDTDDVKVGPSLKGIASRAGTRVDGQDAATYIHNAIVTPNAYLVQDSSGQHVFAANGVSLMYQNYKTDLTEAQINDLVAYLLTQK
jgi:cytochrome c2